MKKVRIDLFVMEDLQKKWIQTQILPLNAAITFRVPPSVNMNYLKECIIEIREFEDMPMDRWDE